jgi:hypothetical protein
MKVKRKVREEKFTSSAEWEVLISEDPYSESHQLYCQ